jgi:hypothetical protein
LLFPYIITTIVTGCWWLRPIILAIPIRSRDQEDCSSKPYSSMRSYLEKPFTKIGLVEWLKVEP